MSETQEIQTAADDHYDLRFTEIGRLVRLWEQAQELGHDGWVEEIRERLEQMPLSVELVAVYPVRESCEWSILLGTGGPADRVLVTTDYAGGVEQADYQHQDWFTPWTSARNQSEETVKSFAQCFYFGTVAVSVDGDVR